MQCYETILFSKGWSTKKKKKR